MAHIRALLGAAACAACLATAARGEELAATDAGLAAVPGPVAPVIPTGPAAPALGRSKHVLGLQLGAGFPDGASASVLYRPLRYLRLDGGLLYNYAGYGVSGGVTVLPYFAVAPTLSLEAGHFFEANAADRFSRFFTISDSVRPMLQRVGYTFVDLSAGLEFGHPDWFVFFVRGGLSRVWASVHGFQAAAQGGSGGAQVTSASDPDVTLNVPNAKLGFILYFY